MNFKILLYIVILFVFFSCKEKESFKDVNIAVHGVSGLYNPKSFFIENTLEAMDYALQFEELDGIEIDVQFSSDGSLWMFHDEYLDDRTNQNGRVCENSDELLFQTSYTGLKSPSLAMLSTIDWSMLKGSKNIYLEVKIFNSCSSKVPHLSILIEYLDNLSQNENLTIYPVINIDSIAQGIHDAGYQVYVDVDSYSSAKQKLSSFYTGVLIRNKKISGSEVADLQINGKKVILFDMFSDKGIREGFKKHPDVLLVEDFKSAIIERN
jgi:glycerophosphoryl diester phosphodiesterase